jgi:multidrug resistance efflux pump
MGVLSSILLWPLAPVRGVLALGEAIQQQVEQEQRNPALARRELETAEEGYQAGEISAEELENTEQQVLNRMTARPGGGLELDTRRSDEEG